MILPIVAYGNPVLRKVAHDIEKDYPALPKLIEDMWETLYASSGVGLAAPQINKSIRLFVVYSEQIFRQLEEDKEKHSYPDAPGIKQVFINAHIKELDGFEWSYNEGCLSIPKVREDIKRQSVVTLEYLDEEFDATDERDEIVTFIRESNRGIIKRFTKNSVDEDIAD